MSVLSRVEVSLSCSVLTHPGRTLPIPQYRAHDEMLNLRDIVHIAAHVSLPRMAALSHFPCEAPSVIVVLVVLLKARGGVIAVVVAQPEMPEASPSSSLFFRPTQQHAPPFETSQSSPAQLPGKRSLSAECALCCIFFPPVQFRLAGRSNNRLKLGYIPFTRMHSEQTPHSNSDTCHIVPKSSPLPTE